jgi:hypothetical protein
MRAGHAVPALGALAITSTVGGIGTLAAHASAGVADAGSHAADPQTGDAAVLNPRVGYPTRIVTHAPRRDVLSGSSVTVRGRVVPLAADAPLALQARRGHRWVTVAHTRTGRSGRYVLRFRPRQTGSLRIRVRFAGNAVDAATAQPAGVINVYRLAGASWYGPGGTLACGGTLTSGTLGVAHRTLPCGFRVTLHYGGRTVRVPVVDRGPYVGGRDYDLTPATKARLRFGDTGTLWATA